MPSPSTTRRAGSFTETITIAVAAALLAAVWEIARVAWRVVGRDEIAHASSDVLWMAPAATLLLWLAVAVPSGLVARVLPRPWALRLAGTGFWSLAALSILLPYSQLARAAVAILAFGAGVAMARAIAERPERWLARLRVFSVIVLVGVGGIAGGRAVREGITRRGALAALPAPVPGAPNVLLIVVDAGRADAFSSYGYARRTTPHLDAVARDGAVFETAIAPAPWTLPSHVTMFSGRYQFPDSARSAFLRLPADEDFPVLAETFRELGYETAAFVANFFYTGSDTQLDRGFITYRDHPRTLEQTLRSSTFGQTALARGLYGAGSLDSIRRVLAYGDFTVPPKAHHAEKDAADVTDQVLAWIERREPRPFFVFLNYYDTHKPYDPPPPYLTRFAPVPTPRDRYDGALAFIDAHVGRLLQALRARHVLDNTLVIVTSDHGELFGEHGLHEHTSNLYYPLLHVPLIMRWPGRVPAGERVQAAVSLRDLPATIGDLLGDTRLHAFPGATLAALWGGGVDGDRSPVFAAVERGVRSDSMLPFTKGDMVTLFDDTWHYIRNNGSAQEELYRYRDDPAEAEDHARRVGSDSVVWRFRNGVTAVQEGGATVAASVLRQLGWGRAPVSGDSIRERREVRR